MIKPELQAFIDKVAEPAQKDYERTSVFPSLVIAQAILESGWGKSKLAVEANNLFGMRGEYNGSSVMGSDDDVDKDGNRHPVMIPFRKYPSFAESMQDHGATLMKDRYLPVRNAKDYKEGAQALYNGGYAGDRDYPSKLITIIEKYNLAQYDAVKRYHKVVSGNTVSGLAKEYGSTIEDIKKWNDLDDKYLIKVGQVLRVK